MIDSRRFREGRVGWGWWEEGRTIVEIASFEAVEFVLVLAFCLSS